jgi:hypothetical protein
VDTAADLALVGTLAVIWLTAGLLADALPDATTARALHRRTGVLSLLVAAGTAVLAAVPLTSPGLGGASAATAAALLPAVPVVVVLGATVRRLARLRRGAAALSAAPLTPAPPGLRAAAAHPLVATPLQVTGLAALAGLPVAGGLISVPRASVIGMTITFVALAVVAIGVRHALRHSRLAELGMPVLVPVGRRTGSPR